MQWPRMIAFHGDPQIQETYLARVEAHAQADAIVHGQYWQDGKGCAVGCTVHGSDHMAYERELGIPNTLAYLEDNIFESLSPPHDVAWPHRFLSAPHVGADLSLVWPRFALALLTDPEHGVLRYVLTPEHAMQKAAIEQVATLYKQWIAGDAAGAAAGAARAARAAAGAAAWSVAGDARVAGAAAWSAGWAAAGAAAGAAGWAAAGAAARAARAAAGAAARLWQADTLLRLMREAPVPEGAII